MKPNNNFLFFWGHTQKDDTVTKACLSQWYPCTFNVDGITYNCAEQYMMAEKAKIFNDKETRDKILEEINPKIIKNLGRQVKNYNDEIWNNAKFTIVIKGNLAKFSQNQDLKEFLLSTEDKTIVEASPYDKVWGIGMSADNPDACIPEKWKGQNLLGKALEVVRNQLSKKS